jgi:ribosomal-protein-alanine N-acetyltransferase
MMKQDYHTITVRPARTEDAPEMDAINRRNLPENYPLYEWKLALGSSPISFVAKDDNNKMVGYCLSVITNFTHGIECTVASIAVDKEYRRKGIAEGLMRKSLEAMESLGATSITLVVRISNASALKLYHKLGFTKSKLLTKYYQDKEDAYLMKKIQKNTKNDTT